VVSGIDKADPKVSGTYRAALAAVIILSVLLVLALVAVAAGFARQYRLYRADRPSLDGAAASVSLAPDAHILSAAADSGKLVLHVRTSEGSEVDIFDLATGRLTSRIKDGGR
jgi:hypothetical protein